MHKNTSKIIGTKNESNIASSNLWNNKPVGSKRSSAPEGSPRYFQEIENYRYNYETPFIPKFFEFHKLSEKNVLEIGVGHGIDAKKMIINGAQYTGIDITMKHINLASKNVSQLKNLSEINSPKFVFGDLLNEDFNEKEFDYIYSFGVLHHIFHEEEFFKRINYILKDDGKLLFGVYSKYSFFNAYLLITWVFKNFCRNSFLDWSSHIAEDSELLKPVFINIRCKKEIVKLIKKTGFKVVRYSKCGFVQNYIPILGKYFSPNGKVLTFLGSILGWYHCFECQKDLQNK